MSRIRSKNTKPELRLFEILNDAGIAFERHTRVAGVTVDAQIGDRVVVFADSPFWHLRDAALLERLSDSWRAKLLRNRRRDRRQVRHLRASGYTVVRIWADELDPKAVLRRVRSAQTRASRRHGSG